MILQDGFARFVYQNCFSLVFSVSLWFGCLLLNEHRNASSTELNLTCHPVGFSTTSFCCKAFTISGDFDNFNRERLEGNIDDFAPSDSSDIISVLSSVLSLVGWATWDVTSEVTLEVRRPSRWSRLSAKWSTADLMPARTEVGSCWLKVDAHKVCSKILAAVAEDSVSSATAVSWCSVGPVGSVRLRISCCSVWYTSWISKTFSPPVSVSWNTTQGFLEFLDPIRLPKAHSKLPKSFSGSCLWCPSASLSSKITKTWKQSKTISKTISIIQGWRLLTICICISHYICSMLRRLRRLRATSSYHHRTQFRWGLDWLQVLRFSIRWS